MPFAAANGMDLYYETFGQPSDPALLLVMGLGAQCIVWPQEFCQMLADGGRYVIRFDNRDCGLSTHLDGAEVNVEAVMMASLGMGEMPSVPYLLSDFADDAFGLLDALDVPAAHIVGASMGGMIVQQMAIARAERVLSLTSIMSTTGEVEFFETSPEAMAVLTGPPATTRDEYIDRSVPASRACSTHSLIDEDVVRAAAAASYDRGLYPEGGPRHMAASLASGSRADGLRTLRVPTLVIHGRADQLIKMSGGLRTAELVPNARLLLINEMGHDLPRPHWPTMVSAILTHSAGTGHC